MCKMMPDIIPDGIFYAGEYDGVRISAIRMMEELGVKIAHDFPDLGLRVAEDYGTIAQSIFSRDYQSNPTLYTKAVGHAMRLLVDNITREPIQMEKRRQNLEAVIGDRTVHNTMAARARHEQGIGVDVNAMILGRGLVPWSDKEKVRAFMLSLEMKTKSGHPEYDQISIILNKEFHCGNNIRSSKTVADFIKGARVKNPKYPKYKLLFDTSHRIFNSEHLPEELSSGGVKFDPSTGTVWISDNVPLEHRLFWARHEHTCAPNQDPQACSNATKKEIQILGEEHPDMLGEYVTGRVTMIRGVLRYGEINPGKISELVREKLSKSLHVLEKAVI